MLGADVLMPEEVFRVEETTEETVSEGKKSDLMA